MNELSEIFLTVKDGETVTLEKNRIYHVRQDDSFEMTGFYCSNTARKNENPKGLRRCAIFLEDKKNITIDGNGACILIHGKMTSVLFSRCENITVKNLIIDYARPTMSEFKILSNNNGFCEIEINPECLFRIEKNNLIWQGETGPDGKPYWEQGYIAEKGYIKLFNPETELSCDFSRKDLEFSKIVQTGERTLKVELKNKNVFFPEGYILQERNIIRDQTGSLSERCKNLTFENLRVKFMHGLGMVSQFCENVTYRNCDFTPAEGRTTASTADFFQFSGCKGELVIDSCKARGAHDDYINVHGTHLRIIRKNKRKRTITVRFMHHESWGFQAFEEGDTLEFIKWDTLIPYAETKVLKYELLNDTDIRLHLDRELPEITLGKDVVENATWTPSLHVKNCSFGPTSGRGILCTTRKKVVIENNVFRNLWGPALLLEDDCNFWFESGYTTEVVFRNNEVTRCEIASMWETSPVIRYSPKVMDENSEEFVHGKLVLTGNKFSVPKEEKHSIWLEYLREAEITDNTFDAPYIIHKKCVGSITEENNKICCKR
ncbi:MAG: hypothetical protein E7555_04185 [Ruminococcaceae bacterium]|nr:hypothetical protein [Oscillospiraceae bacterium]